MIIRSARSLLDRYPLLTAGDIFVGTVGPTPLREALFVDMAARGIRCFPSALSQMISRSKVSQAFLFRDWMVPETRIIARRTDLLDAINGYARAAVGPVVSKENHMHCGHGIRRWDSVESLYSHVGLSPEAYPFVLQPFQDGFADVRAIFVGDYVEAYERHNPDNFRQNLSSGGRRRPFRLTPEQESFCRRAMGRGNFPFAHIDLMVFPDGGLFLSEIALNGGIKGATIRRGELDLKKQDLLERLAGCTETEETDDEQDSKMEKVKT